MKINTITGIYFVFGKLQITSPKIQTSSKSVFCYLFGFVSFSDFVLRVLDFSYFDLFLVTCWID